MDELENVDLLGTPLITGGDFLIMLMRFAFNTVVVWIMIRFLYYPKSKRRDFYFTFMMISISIFFLIFLLGGVKLKIGFALGLFAIFGIIRYRTESMSVREMTYLFSIIAISVINALASSISLAELVCTNLIFLAAASLFESNILVHHESTKLIQYDRIELIRPESREELKADLEKRTGLQITKLQVGAIDFLRDMAIVKIYYRTDTQAQEAQINHELKISREEWTDVKE